MASQSHPLCSPPPCPTSNGSMVPGGGQLTGSPETGDVRLKPPVKPKPRTLPKPAVPAKSCALPPSPGPRSPRLELPSAEKINLLAGPKPYGGSNTALKRLSFSIKSPLGETPNGKGPPPATARDPPCAVEEGSSVPVTSPAGGPLRVLKGATPFKVKPVPVAAKPERFPGTTVEEILAKMERPRKERPGSPEQAWGLRSTFSPDSASRFGPKGYAAFRRQSSTEGGEGGIIVPGFEASQESVSPEDQESRAPHGNEPPTSERKREGSLGSSGQESSEPPDREVERDPGPASRESGFSPAGASCDGDEFEHRRSPASGLSLAWTSPVPVSVAELTLGAAPGSPGLSVGLAQTPGAPDLPAEFPASAAGSPSASAELPAPGSPSTHAELPSGVRSGSPDTPKSQAKSSISLVQAPGAPDVPAEPSHIISCSPGSPDALGDGFPASSGLSAGLAPDALGAPTERPHSPTIGQLLAPGIPDAPTVCPHSRPAGQPLAPGTPNAATEHPHSPPPRQLLTPGTTDDPTKLPPRITHSPGAPETPIPSLDTPSLSPKLPTKVDLSPGSPEGPAESPGPPDGSLFPERGSPSPPSDAAMFMGPVPVGEDFQPLHLGQRRSSDGLVQLPGKGLGKEVLGGSLAALPREGLPMSRQPLEGESNWSLSQSFEWAFPSRAPEWEPPRSPIREADDSNHSDQGDSGGEGPAPGPRGSGKGSGSERQGPGHPSAALDWQAMEDAESSAHPDDTAGDPCDRGATELGRLGDLEATCPGGPVSQGEVAVAELIAPAVMEEASAIWEEPDRPLLGTHLWLTEPGPSQERATPLLFSDVPGLPTAVPCQEDDSAQDVAQAGSCQEGPRSGETGSEPHPDSRWLDELLASPPPNADETKRMDMLEPGDTAGSEDLLGWSRKDLCSEFGIRGAHRAGELGWASEPGTGRRDWPSGYGAGETEQDREFGTGSRDWAGTYKELELLSDSNVGHGNWPDAYGIGDSRRKDGELSSGKPDWSSQYSVGGAESRDGEFGTRKLDWSSTYGIEDSAQQGREFDASQPAWTHEHGVSDPDQQEREFGTRKPAWTHEHGISGTDHQGKEFGAGQPDGTCGYGLGSTTPQDKEFGIGKPDWSHEFSAGGSVQRDRELSTDKPDWLGECGICQVDRESAIDSRSRDESTARDPDPVAQEPDAGRPRWSSSESKFPFARRDDASDFEHKSQFGVIGTDRVGGFVVNALDPCSAVGTLDPTGLGESPADWAGHSRTLAVEEPREAGVGQSDWTRDLSLHGTDSSVSLAAVKSDDLGEHGRGWMDRANDLSVSSMDPSSGMGVGGFDTSREAAEGQPDRASDLCVGSLATASGFGRIGLEDLGDARVRQTDWVHELSSRAESSTETGEAGVGQMDWASEVRIDHGQENHGCSMGGSEPHGNSSGPVGPRLSDPSPRLEEMLAKATAQCKGPVSFQDSCSGEEWGPHDATDAHHPEVGHVWPLPLLQEEDDGSRPEGVGVSSPSAATDGGLLLTDMKRLSQSSMPVEDFSFLEDTEILDSAIYRNRANLGRKRGHRAPALHPRGPLGLCEVEASDEWMFRDSTEPRMECQASSDEEVAEEPQSRRARPSPKGVKVSLFPGLSPSVLKAKLRGRNRSAEEGAQLGDAKEPHVQRSKSCKIPGLGGKPPVLPPKPEKSSGSDASSPHWLQVLKLKKKKS